MKLDDNYFEAKFSMFIMGGNTKADLIHILKRIAHDALAEGLRVAVKAVENCSHTFMRQIDSDEAIAAIKAQEGK